MYLLSIRLGIKRVYACADHHHEEGPGTATSLCCMINPDAPATQCYFNILPPTLQLCLKCAIVISVELIIKDYIVDVISLIMSSTNKDVEVTLSCWSIWVDHTAKRGSCSRPFLVVMVCACVYSFNAQPYTQ